MNKKGFTLIELLAVILVLGIIALIAIPTVTKVIKQAKKGAAEASALEYVKAVENQISLNNMDSDEINDLENGEYTITELAQKGVELKGTLPDDDSTVTIENGEITYYNLIYGEFVFNPELEKVCEITSGDGTEIGDEIKCGTEFFNIYAFDGNNLKLFAKYNLKVGGYVVPVASGSFGNFNHTYTEYQANEITNMQDSTMLGRNANDAEGNVYNGTVAFGTTDGVGYTGSYAEIYVNNYKNALKNLGVMVLNASLITRDEILQLGCTYENYNFRCTEATGNLAFVLNTSYWLDYTNWYQGAIRGYQPTFPYSDFPVTNNTEFGIRPTIVVPKGIVEGMN